MQEPATLQIQFQPVTESDLDTLRDWIGRPHWQQWWLAPDEEVSYIRSMIEGRDTTRPFIFHVGGEPMGYIQYRFIGDHQNADWFADHPWLADLPSDAVGVDLSIADASDLAKGIGSTVLAEFAQGLVTEGWRTIIIDPDPNNARAIRAYAKAGFRPIPALFGKTGDSLIMRYQPGTSEQP
ncbi:MAG: acetyltransferase [Alphaproteobacteria bacterium]|nr:acetyltransferase [Alphaproteobacteria bacterium]